MANVLVPPMTNASTATTLIWFTTEALPAISTVMCLAKDTTRTQSSGSAILATLCAGNAPLLTLPLALSVTYTLPIFMKNSRLVSRAVLLSTSPIVSEYASPATPLATHAMDPPIQTVKPVLATTFSSRESVCLIVVIYSIKTSSTSLVSLVTSFV